MHGVHAGLRLRGYVRTATAEAFENTVRRPTAILLKAIGGCATSYPTNFPTAKRSAACQPKTALRRDSKGRRLRA